MKKLYKENKLYITFMSVTMVVMVGIWGYIGTSIVRDTQEFKSKEPLGEQYTVMWTEGTERAYLESDRHRLEISRKEVHDHLPEKGRTLTQKSITPTHIKFYEKDIDAYRIDSIISK